MVLAIKLQNRISLIIQLLKPFIFYHRAVLLSGFADVDAAWRWGPLVSHISPLLSLFSSPSPLSFFCLHHRQPPASEPPSVVQPPCAASPPVGTRRTPQRAPSPSAGTRRTCIGDGGNGHGVGQRGRIMTAETATGWPAWANYDGDTPANDLLTSFRSNYLDV